MRTVIALEQSLVQSSIGVRVTKHIWRAQECSGLSNGAALHATIAMDEARASHRSILEGSGCIPDGRVVLHLRNGKDRAVTVSYWVLNQHRHTALGRGCEQLEEAVTAATSLESSRRHSTACVRHAIRVDSSEQWHWPRAAERSRRINHLPEAKRREVRAVGSGNHKHQLV